MDSEYLKDDELYSGLIDYWIQVWSYNCDEIDKGYTGARIININLVLNDIINEFQFNDFNSLNNRKTYISLVEKLLKNQSLKNERKKFILLKDVLENKKDSNSVVGRKAYTIAKEIQESINKDEIINYLYDEIVIIIKSKKNTFENRQKLKRLSFELILELLTSGVVMNRIKKFVFRIFETYKIVGNLLITNYIYCPRDVSDDEKKDYIDNLTITQRLEDFKHKLVIKKNKFRVSFPLYGISIMNTLSWGDFELSHIEQSDSDNYEMLLVQKWLNSDKKIKATVLASTYVEATSSEGAGIIAKKKLDLLLGLINKNPRNCNDVVITNGDFEVFDLEDKKVSSTMIADNTGISKILSKICSSVDHPLFVDENIKRKIEAETKIFEELRKRQLFKEINIITETTRLLNQTSNLENEKMLLNYWIVLESLANLIKDKETSTFDFIKKFSVNISTLLYPRELLEDILDDMFFYNHSISIHSTRKSKELFDELNWGVYGKSFNKEFFFDHLDEISSNIEDLVLRDRLSSFKELSSDNSKMNKMILEEENNIKITIDYIYKCRNQIVHNGYVDQNMIPHLVKITENYAKILYQFVLDAYKLDNFNLEEEFYRLEYKTSLFKERLKKDDNFNIYFDNIY